MDGIPKVSNQCPTSSTPVLVLDSGPFHCVLTHYLNPPSSVLTVFRINIFYPIIFSNTSAEETTVD